MSETAKLIFDGTEYEFPVVEGSEGEKGIDINDLRKRTGLITLDPGYVNTGSCISDITFIDGEQGILRYRGYPIEELAEKSTFVETTYLLLHNALPTRSQLSRFSSLLSEHALVHEDMRRFLEYFPADAHPMNILGCMVNALSSFYPNVDARSMDDDIDITAARMISKIRTLAALAYKKSIGEPRIYPRLDLPYCANFLNMMFSSPTRPYQLDDDMVKALNMLLIMHADHEQNCSTSAVRLVGSSHANLYASISCGIAALWGPLHGGANQAVMEMLGKIRDSGQTVDDYISKAKDKESGVRLMGFGHRVYKNYDPRARIIKNLCAKVVAKHASEDSLFDIALQLEEKVLADDYFVSRKLYPNVDFYSGLLYRAMGFPTNMFTVLFAIGRLPGWISQWKEMVSDTSGRIGRPRQIYSGQNKRSYVAIEERS